MKYQDPTDETTTPRGPNSVQKLLTSRRVEELLSSPQAARGVSRLLASSPLLAESDVWGICVKNLSTFFTSYSRIRVLGRGKAGDEDPEVGDTALA